MHLSVIIVNWNGRECLEGCLRSLLEETLGEMEVLVVDNASGDGSPEMVKRHFPGVSLIGFDRNLGFARAANEGVRQSRGEYILLLNPDTLILPGAIRGMVSFLEGHPRMGAVGPRLLNPDGSVQPSWGRFPGLRSEAIVQLYLYRLLPAGRPVGRRMPLFARLPGEPMPVDWVVGACLMTRRRVWEEVGPLCEEIFLYGEDLDWCWRVRQAGWSIGHLPQARVVHCLWHSADRDPASKILHQAHGMRRFFRLYRSARAACTHEILIVLGALLRWMLWRLKGCLSLCNCSHALIRERAYAEILRRRKL